MWWERKKCYDIAGFPQSRYGTLSVRSPVWTTLIFFSLYVLAQVIFAEVVRNIVILPNFRHHALAANLPKPQLHFISCPPTGRRRLKTPPRGKRGKALGGGGESRTRTRAPFPAKREEEKPPLFPHGKCSSPFPSKAHLQLDLEARREEEEGSIVLVKNWKVFLKSSGRQIKCDEDESRNVIDKKWQLIIAKKFCGNLRWVAGQKNFINLRSLDPQRHLVFFPSDNCLLFYYRM